MLRHITYVRKAFFLLDRACHVLPKVCIALRVLAHRLGAACQADIFRWDNGQLIPGTRRNHPGARRAIE